MAGNITIIEAREQFVKVPKNIIFNEKIDHVTLAVYTRVLVLGKRWNLNIAGAASVLHISKERVRAVFAKLEEAGYLRRKRSHDANGKFSGWDYEISNAPLTDTPETPTSEEHRRRENTDVGKTPTSEKFGGIIEDYKGVNEDINPITENHKYSAGFDFRRSLIDLGVPAALVDDWLKVRHAKRATNTQTAYEAIEREIKKSGRPAEVCIRFVVERSWAGFKAEWLNEEEGRTRQGNQRPAPRREESLTEHYARVNREIEQILHGNGRDYDNQ